MLIDLKQIIHKHNFDIKGIVALGANKGQEAELYDDLGVNVIWVEAIPGVCQELSNNISKYSNQIAINACVSDRNGDEKIFHVSNNEAQSSSYLPLGTHKEAHPEVHYVDSIALITVRVDAIIKSLEVDIDEKWMLVADLQGAEMDALIGCGELLHKFGFIYLEVNKKYLYQGCALKNEIEEYLAFHNFIPIAEFIYEQFGWGDELFAKKDLL